MFLFLYLFSLALSGTNYDENTKTLTIDGDVVTISDVSQYNQATTLSVTGSVINIGQSSFISFSSLEKVTISGLNSVITARSSCFKGLKNLKEITFGGSTINLEDSSFADTKIDTIKCNSDAAVYNFKESSFTNSEIQNIIFSASVANFYESSFSGAKINSFTGNLGSAINFKESSYINSKIQTMTIITTTANFQKSSFSPATIEKLDITSLTAINFLDSSFYNANVSFLTASSSTMNFQTKSFSLCILPVFKCTATNFVFYTDSFNGFKGSQEFILTQPTNVIFNEKSFINSEIPKLEITEATNIHFYKYAFQSSKKLSNVNLQSKGNITIGYSAFKDCTSLTSVDIKSTNLSVSASVFCGCSSLSKPVLSGQYQYIDECVSECCPDPDDGEDDDDGDEKKGKGKSSSGKDNDDTGKSARTLGNIDIETVYLGTSPNIYFNFNFLVSFMKSLRKSFGCFLPSPELVHSAIWVGEKNAKDDSIGALFVYGKYHNKNKNPSFLWNDGAKGYPISFKEFKRKYQSMKLNPQKNVKLFDFINDIKESGNWGVRDYNWPTNNCQHFTSKLIMILRATRDSPNNDDWIDLPKSILNSLESNEKSLN